jgi:Fe-S cluster assembly protein SufD
VRTLKHFGPDQVAALGGPSWLEQRRKTALARLGELTAPTADSADVWRYSPIDQLDLDAFRPAAPPAEGDVAGIHGLAEELSRGPRIVVGNGTVRSVERAGLPSSVGLGPAAALASAPESLGTLAGGNDFFVALNDSFLPDAVVLEIPPGVVLEEAIAIVHLVGPGTPDGPGPTVFPRTLVHVGENAEAKVVEVFAGGGGPGRSLVVPVGELVVEDRGRLSYVMVQDLGPSSWHLARLNASVGRDGTLRSFTAGLGGAYDRCRLDASALGEGGSTEVTSVYLGSGDQVHDVRTMQDHAAPRTTSDLLCKGAVAERSNSIYSGLIRVRNGAVRSDAMQTNHNLVLDESAHAYSLPILDIEENDVRCSHASSVGPVSEDQRYYLESRGLSPEVAERLIVLGFFDDIVERAPIGPARTALRSSIGRRLGALLGRTPQPDE